MSNSGLPKIIQPEGWKAPKGYSNGVLASGQILFIAGQIGWDKECRLVSAQFLPQVRQALLNVVEVVASSGGKSTDIARMSWFIIDRAQYLSLSKEIGIIYREVIGSHYPAMSLVEVSNLLETGALVEIEATAVIAQR